MNKVDIECYLPGVSHPVSIEVYVAYMKGRMEKDRAEDCKSIDLPDVFSYDPATAEPSK